MTKRSLELFPEIHLRTKPLHLDLKKLLSRQFLPLLQQPEHLHFLQVFQYLYPPEGHLQSAQEFLQVLAVAESEQAPAEPESV